MLSSSFSVARLAHLFRQSCTITTARTISTAALASANVQHNGNNIQFYKNTTTTTTSSASFSSSPVANSSSVAALRPSSDAKLRLNSREKKFKIFRIIKAKEKLKRHRNFYGPRLRIAVNETYIAQLLDTYAAKRTYRPAIKMYARLREKNLRPSVYAYRKFLFTIGYRGRQTEAAEYIFEDMRDSECAEEMRTDRYCHNIMMHIYAKNVGGIEGYEKARKLFNSMAEARDPNARPNSFSYYYLLKCFLPNRQQVTEDVDTAEEEHHESTAAVELSKDEREIVRGIVAEMLQDDVILLSNRHIKSILETFGMQQEVEEIYESISKE